MSGTLLLINTMAITPGKLDQFKRSVAKAVAFAEAHAPQLLVRVYLDEAQLRAQSFQYYRDSASILAHWQLSDPYIQEVNQHITVERLDLYGQPSDEVLTGIRQAAARGVTVTVTPHLVGFDRFQPADVSDDARERGASRDGD